MEKILDFILCGGIVGLELIVVFIIAMLIQGVIYWTTGISIYNYMKRIIR